MHDINTALLMLCLQPTRKGFEILLLALPPVCLPNITAHDQISQAFPLRI